MGIRHLSESISAQMKASDAYFTAICVHVIHSECCQTPPYVVLRLFSRRQLREVCSSLHTTHVYLLMLLTFSSSCVRACLRNIIVIFQIYASVKRLLQTAGTCHRVITQTAYAFICGNSDTPVPSCLLCAELSAGRVIRGKICACFDTSVSYFSFVCFHLRDAGASPHNGKVQDSISRWCTAAAGMATSVHRLLSKLVQVHLRAKMRKG